MWKMDKTTVIFEEMQTYENNDEVLIIDVREPKEIEETGKIGGSINIPCMVNHIFFTFQ